MKQKQIEIARGVEFKPGADKHRCRRERKAKARSRGRVK